MLVARFPPSRKLTRRFVDACLHNEQGLTLQAARAAAVAWNEAIRSGIDPTATTENAADNTDAVSICDTTSSQRVTDALDLYEANESNLMDRGAADRRALDGREEIRKDLRDQPIRARRSYATRSSQGKRAPIAVNRQISYLKAFLSWCVDEEFVDTSVAETIKRSSADVRLS